MLQKFDAEIFSFESVFFTIFKSQILTQAQTTIEIAEKYDENHIQAMHKIQRFWRYVYPKIRKERKLMKTPQNKLIVHFKIICKEYLVFKNMRDLLTSFNRLQELIRE